MFRTRSSDLAQAFFRPSSAGRIPDCTPDVAAPSGAAFCLPAGGALGASVESAGMQAVSGNDRPQVALDDDGLVPCIAQDWATGEVLTLAYMNREALERTLESGEIHFWSRSRQELWHKGETSGNVQRLRSLRYDCDADALLALVEPAGPACHTGERTCFYRSIGDGSRWPRTRRSRRSRARSPRGIARCRTAATRPSCSAPGPERIGGEGRGGGRGGRARRPRGERRAPARGGGRPALPPRRACWRRAGCRSADALDELVARMDPSTALMAVATLQLPVTPTLERGARAGARPQRDPAAPHVHRRLRDAGVGVPEAARPRAGVPARVGRAGPALRPLLVPRLPPARDAALRERRAQRSWSRARSAS